MLKTTLDSMNNNLLIRRIVNFVNLIHIYFRYYLLIIILWIIEKNLLPSKIFCLGKGKITRYTIFEIKWLCSLYIHHIETQCQDRYHTHAFNAWVYIVSGKYNESVKHGIGPGCLITTHKYEQGMLRYIPQELNHCILQAERHTFSLLFTGPYSSIWTEETEQGVLRILTKGRIPMYEIQMV